MRLTLRHLSLAIAVLCLRSAGAQSGPTSGLYRIISGSYIERSGTLGDSFSSLPNASQRFVRLLVDTDPQSYLVTMTFLGEDLQTVFSVIPCPPGGPVSFSFFGSAYTDPMTFHVDPSPPPDEQAWSYTASNSFNTLRIDGQVVALRRSCAEDQEFVHSNVVAVLVAPPRIRISEYSKENGTLLFIQGNAGSTNVVEASTDLVSWTAVSTNLCQIRYVRFVPTSCFATPRLQTQPASFIVALKFHNLVSKAEKTRQ